MVQRNEQEKIIPYVPGYEEVVPDMLSAVQSKGFGVLWVVEKLLQVVIRAVERISENSGVLVGYLQGDASDRCRYNRLGLPKRLRDRQTEAFS
ncbi:Uncharacterised protein [uncultured archaeon]|nr:Uncharacterised protein [uncultured archaeon]